MLERKDPPRERKRPKRSSQAESGRLGGLKGGPARAKALTARRRYEIAQKAARARWAKRLEAMLEGREL